MRFLVDAQLPPGLARRLATRGYQCAHVNDVGLRAASDRSVWRYATRNSATLITKDEDLATFAARDPAGPQVVWIRVGNISNDALWRAIEPQLDEIIEALDAGERIIEVL